MSDNYKSIRIFKNPLLEACTHVHPIVPAVMWVPIISVMFYFSYVVNQVSFLEHLSLLFLGFFFWTLSEYLLHRYVFHFPAKGKLGKWFVFLFHGLHHDDPQDPTRLVMPPVPALFFSFLLYLFYGLFIPNKYLLGFMAFFMIGYLFYDYIHFATHHFKMTSKVGRYLKKFHLQHHHSHDPVKYGVSSPIWDYIFGTVGDRKGRL